MTVQRPSPRLARPVHAIVLALVLAGTLSVVCGPESRAEDRGRGVTLVGLVEQLPENGLVGEWRVAGRTVVVGTETTIDERRAPVTIGALVDVRGTVDARGTITAQAITVKAGGQQPISCTFAVVHLQPTGTTLPDAEGIVVAREFVRADGSTREDLRVGVQGLAPETAYEVVFDGITAGSIETCDEGEGHLFLSTAEVPGAGILPPELSPVTGLHEAAVLDPTGLAVLAGSFADARREACGQPSLDYLAVAMLRDRRRTPRRSRQRVVEGRGREARRLRREVHTVGRGAGRGGHDRGRNSRRQRHRAPTRGVQHVARPGRAAAPRGAPAGSRAWSTSRSSTRTAPCSPRATCGRSPA